ASRFAQKDGAIVFPNSSRKSSQTTLSPPTPTRQSERKCAAKDVAESRAMPRQAKQESGQPRPPGTILCPGLLGLLPSECPPEVELKAPSSVWCALRETIGNRSPERAECGSPLQPQSGGP